MDHFPRCFVVSSDSACLFVGGTFKYVRQGQDSLLAAGLARWDGSQWSVSDLDPPLPDSIAGTFRNVLSIAQVGDTLLVGNSGGYWNWDYTVMNHGTRLVNGAWQPFGEPNFGIDLFNVNGRTFIGGDNTDSIFGQAMQGVGEYRNGIVNPLPNSPFNQPLDFYGATYWHGQYYFAGNTWGELGSPDIVAYDGDSTWSGVGGGMGIGWLQTVAGFGDSLYVGGYFFPGGNNLSTHIQLFDGTQWQPFFPQVEYIGQVWDIQVYQGALYVWGTYHFQGESTLYGLLRFDGRELCAIGGPMDVAQGKMAFFQHSIYASLYTWYPGLELEWIGYLPLDGLIPDTCITITQSGISEREVEQLGVYPNPGTDHLTITTSSAHYPVDLFVRDMTGRLVHWERLTQNIFIDAGAWAVGSYSIELRDAEQNAISRSTWLKAP